jgi:hypothetical protein
MILILRGHIRNSFDNKNLYELVNEISKKYDNLKIYIHTWNIFSNNISWRKIQTNNTIVTKDTINHYFGELAGLIKHIIIDDETKIKLIGKTSGNVCDGPAPLIGWKNYHYGIYNILNYVIMTNIDKNEVIINTRFDILNNSNSVNTNILLFFIEHNPDVSNIKKNIFLLNHPFCGCDNIYIGNIYTMHKLTYLMNFHLDDVMKKYPEIKNQELLVFFENEML